MKFKPGDTVRVRRDLIGGSTYGGLYFNEYMEDYCGMVFVVARICKDSEVGGLYELHGTSDWIFNDAMLEPADKDKFVSTEAYAVHNYPILVSYHDGEWRDKKGNPVYNTIVYGERIQARLDCDIFNVGSAGDVIDVININGRLWLPEECLPMCGVISKYAKLIEEE